MYLILTHNSTLGLYLCIPPGSSVPSATSYYSFFNSWDSQELSAAFVWLSAHCNGPFLNLEGNDPWKMVEVCMSTRACACEAYYSYLKKATKPSISSWYYWFWSAQWFWLRSCQLAHHPSAVFTRRAILPPHHLDHPSGGYIWIHHS